MRFFKVAMPILGLVLLVYLVGRLGPDTIWRNLLVLRWRFPLILLLACSWHLTNTIAWAFAFPPGSFRPHLRTLLTAKLAGETVNQITPLANLGGEPLKAYLLRQQSPASRGLASVVINKTGQVITGLAFAIVGLGLVVSYWTLPQPIPTPVQAGLATLLGIGVLLFLFMWRQQRRMFSSLLGILRRLGLQKKMLEERQIGAKRIDHSISQFYRHHAFRFALVLLFHSIGWLLGALETMVILRGLGANVNFSVAFFITSLSLVINTLFFFMPSNIGVMEGGQVFLLATLGLDPALGLALGITKRMRKVIWILVGWVCLTRLSHGMLASRRVATEPVARASVQHRRPTPRANIH